MPQIWAAASWVTRLVAGRRGLARLAFTGARCAWPRPAGWPRPNPKTQALRSPTDKTDDWRYDWLSNGVICEFALDRVDLTFAWPSNMESRALPMMLSIWSP